MLEHDRSGDVVLHFEGVYVSGKVLVGLRDIWSRGTTSKKNDDSWQVHGIVKCDLELTPCEVPCTDTAEPKYTSTSPGTVIIYNPRFVSCGLYIQLSIETGRDSTQLSYQFPSPTSIEALKHLSSLLLRRAFDK